MRYVVEIKNEKAKGLFKKVLKDFKNATLPSLKNKIVVDATPEEIKQLEKHPLISFVEKDEEYDSSGESYGWGPQRIHADDAHVVGQKGFQGKVGIIDSGVEDHADLDVYWGVNVGSNGDPSDHYQPSGSYHGTHVAGIATMLINNDEGHVGVVPDAFLYAIRADNEDGRYYASDLVDGINWAVDREIDVLNMSLSGPYSSTLHDAVKDAYNNKVTIVAAAGNDGTDEKQYPAAYAEVISVGGITKYDDLYSNTNYGDWVDFYHPAVDIRSTVAKSWYETMTGTSMAAPHIAGLAVIQAQRFNLSDPDDIKAKLAEQSDTLSGGEVVPIWIY